MVTMTKRIWVLDSANVVSPDFNKKYQSVIDKYFARDAKRWPLYQLPELSDLTQCRLSGEQGDYPQFYEALRNLSKIPNAPSDSGDSFQRLALYAAHTSKNWDDPRSVENVITTPCDPAIHGALLATIANPNLVYQEYAGEAIHLEEAVIRQMANLMGYDSKRATGVFTQGGTFCNLYGYLLGLRKAFPGSANTGIDRDQCRMINSQAAHYSTMTNLSLLGFDLKKHVIQVKVNLKHQVDLEDLARQLEHCFMNDIVVPTIMLTCGTTDSFAVDNVKAVHAIRERLYKQYKPRHRPHIHVDAAAGWSMMFFQHYNFDSNPLSINAATIDGIKYLNPLFAGLKYADSITIDFQKWGYVPYTSSLILLKDATDMEMLKQDPSYFSYFEPSWQDSTHLQSTIECSRSAVGVFSAFSALQALGVEGYQVLIAHGLQNANYLRCQLAKIQNCVVVAADNQGPAVTFRLYSPEAIMSADEQFERERHYSEDTRSVTLKSLYHRQHYLSRTEKVLNSNWVEAMSRTYYEQDKYIYLSGEKAVFFNPHTRIQHIDAFVQSL